MASIILHLAGDKNLRSNVDVWPSCLSSDLDSIGKRRCGGMSPARSTILWDMLVSHVGKVIGSINVVPEKFGWELDGGEFGPDVLDILIGWVPLLLARSGSVDELKWFLGSGGGVCG